MKPKKIFIMCISTGIFLSSCINENFNPNTPKKGIGYMDLSVDVQLPPTTRADDNENIDYTQYQLANNYPVELYNESGSIIESWNHASDVPSSYVLPLGKYMVKAHTGGDVESLMYYPYYAGEKSYNLDVKDAHYQVKVICKMINSSINVNYSDDFSTVYADWTITLVAGSKTVITYSKSDGLKPREIFWLFDEGVEEIKVNFRGTLVDGNTVSDNTYVLTKDWENQGYDDDVKYYTGGDAIVINFKPQESDEGKITGITINANVVFGEEEPININLNVEEVEPEDPNPVDPTPIDPGNDELNYDTDIIGTTTFETDGLPYMVCKGKKTDASTFQVSYGINDDPLPQTEVTICTPHKLKKVLVSIKAGNELFGGVTGGIQNLDLVTNEELRGIISEARPDAALPNGGEETYPFPVYAFYDMINMFGPTDPGKAHEFTIVVEDEAGNTQGATLKVIVND